MDKAEFEPRIAGLKQCMSQLKGPHQTVLAAVKAERGLALVINRLELSIFVDLRFSNPSKRG